MRAFNKDKFSVILEEEEKELNTDPQKSLYSYFVVSCIREGFKYKLGWGGVQGQVKGSG